MVPENAVSRIARESWLVGASAPATISGFCGMVTLLRARPDAATCDLTQTKKKAPCNSTTTPHDP